MLPTRIPALLSRKAMGFLTLVLFFISLLKASIRRLKKNTHTHTRSYVSPRRNPCPWSTTQTTMVGIRASQSICHAAATFFFLSFSFTWSPPIRRVYRHIEGGVIRLGRVFATSRLMFTVGCIWPGSTPVLLCGGTWVPRSP